MPAPVDNADLDPFWIAIRAEVQSSTHENNEFWHSQKHAAMIPRWSELIRNTAEGPQAIPHQCAIDATVFNQAMAEFHTAY